MNAVKTVEERNNKFKGDFKSFFHTKLTIQKVG